MDRLSKYAHCIPVAHPYIASKIAQVFNVNVFKLHGMPNSIVSDRDPMLTSLFSKEMHLNSVQPISRRMDIVKLSTNASGTICDISRVLNLENGLNGYLWHNGGKTQIYILPQKSHILN